MYWGRSPLAEFQPATERAWAQNSSARRTVYVSERVARSGRGILDFRFSILDWCVPHWPSADAPGASLRVWTPSPSVRAERATRRGEALLAPEGQGISDF